MTTVVNNPAPTGTGDSGSGMGFLLGLVVLLLMVFLFFTYGLPALRGSFSTPSINLPGKVDVNVSTPGGQGSGT